MGFESSTDFVLGGVRIGMGCMKVVIVIAWYTWLPVTLSMLLVSFGIIGSRSGLADAAKVTIVSRYYTPFE